MTTETLATMLERRAAQTPGATAFQRVDGGGGWHAVPWGEFARRVRSIGQQLQRAGLHRGDRLAIIAPVSLEWELLHHAALSLGAVVVGLDAHDLPSRVAAMAAQAGVVGIAAVDLQPLSAFSPDDWQRTRFLITLSPHAADVAPAGVSCLALEQDMPGTDADGASSPVQPDDVATIIFTSGTTGAPKGIAYSHRQVCLAVDAICDAFPFAGPDTRLLCWLPLSNLFQRVVNLAAIRTGATTYLWADPRRVMEAVAGVEPDVFIGVPRFFEKLHEGIVARIDAQPKPARALARWAWQIGRQSSLLRRTGQPLPASLRLRHLLAEHLVLRRVRAAVMGDRLRCLVTGSAPTSVALLESFHALGWLVLEAYGLSENVVPMAMNRIDAFRFGTVGRPIAGNQIRIDAKGGVLVRGGGVFQGYWGASPATSGPDADGFHDTGDIGELDADGFLKLTGRRGDMFKTSTGKRVAPAGVEAALRGVRGIDQALLIGAGRKFPVALCTLVPDGGERSEIVRDLQQGVAALNAHERPVAVALLVEPFTIEHGELTPNLKIRRSAVEQRHAAVIESLYEAAARPGRIETELIIV